MDRPSVRIILALLLIGAGLVFLLDSLQILEIGALPWAVLIGAGGLAFLSVFFLDRAQWWALIPGLILLSVAVLIFAGELLPEFEEEWGGTIVLGGVALAFWAVYLVRRDFWWAIIPGGVLLTVAVITGLSTVLEGDLVGALFFLGLGLTFALVALMPTPEGRMKWALIPAGILTIMGLVILAAAGAVFGYIWPLVLILAGLFLLLRLFTARRSL